jgi:hypothetical protein
MPRRLIAVTGAIVPIERRIAALQGRTVATDLRQVGDVRLHRGHASFDLVRSYNPQTGIQNLILNGPKAGVRA